MRRNIRCRKCGEKIWFSRVPTAELGKLRWVPMNFSDRMPHYKRCAMTVSLREEKRLKSRSLDRKAETRSDRPPGGQKLQPPQQRDLWA